VTRDVIIIDSHFVNINLIDNYLLCRVFILQDRIIECAFSLFRVLSIVTQSYKVFYDIILIENYVA